MIHMITWNVKYRGTVFTALFEISFHLVLFVSVQKSGGAGVGGRGLATV